MHHHILREVISYQRSDTQPLLIATRVLLIFQTSRYLWEHLTLIVVLFEGSKNGFRIFLPITKTRPGHFKV